MNYYQFHIGDYSAHTSHLSPIEDCAYRRLLDAYYLHERMLPRDVAACARLVRMREYETEVAQVLCEFFTEHENGWSHSRADNEILRFKDKSGKAKASADVSAKSRRANAQRTLSERTTNAERTHNERSANAELTNNQEPITNTPPNGGDARKRAVRTTKQEIIRPDEVPQAVWQDFQAIRKAKRAPLTDTALDGIRREADRAGLSLADAIAYCCEAGWQGFNASWYADRHAGGGRRAQPQSFRERDRQAAAERVAQFSPRIADKAALIDGSAFEVPNVLAVESR